VLSLSAAAASTYLKRLGHYVAVIGIGGAIIAALLGAAYDRLRVTAKIAPFFHRRPRSLS
jgi:hypothetical protein